MKITLINVLKFVGLLSLASMPTLVLADGSLGDVSNTISGQYDNIMKAIQGGAYIVAAVLGITSVMKFKKYAEDAREGLKPAILYLVAAAVLAVLPTLMGTATTSIFGTSTTQNTDSGTTVLQ